MLTFFKRFFEALQRGRNFVRYDIWRIGLPGEEIPHGLIIKQIRVAILLLRGLSEETLLLRASALTFATMLFIVPFLAFMFYIIQTFDLGDQIYRTIWKRMDSQLAQVITLVKGGDQPAGSAHAPGQSTSEEPDAEPAPPPTPQQIEENNTRLKREIIASIFPIFSAGSGLSLDASTQNPVGWIVSLAERGATNPRAIGVAGILFVLSTVFGFMQNVESSFNRIWGVRRTRNVFRMLSDYMVITLVFPFVAAGVLGISAALESQAILAALGPFSMVLRGFQLAAICLTFSLIYFGVPNTRVRIRYALLGGLVAGILWIFCSWGYVKFQFGLTRYTLFFSTFALFPLLLMWIFMSWLILLFGALLTFAYQHEQTFAMERLADGASYAYREALAIRTMLEIARRFQRGESALSAREAAIAWNVPTRLLNLILECLVSSRLLTECATEPVTYQPARSPEQTRLAEVVRAIREAGQDPSLLRQDAQYKPIYEQLSQGPENTRERTIAALARELDAPPNNFPNQCLPVGPISKSDQACP